ncbi:hypothetical protein FQZ97_1032880 [compost metagenome]
MQDTIKPKRRPKRAPFIFFRLSYTQTDIDIAAGCVRIRADDVCCIDQLFGLGLVHARQSNFKSNIKTKACAVVARTDANRRGHSAVS